ncbi:MAG TPA: glycosyltransferase family 39 protein [Anaerolineae bacterium]|nr:glycosyltransferase family 39 protein [Anaerolineae bacterium]
MTLSVDRRHASPWRWTLALVGLALALAFLLEPVDLAAGLHGPDGRNYLSQLNSLLLDRDLLLYNNNEALGQRIQVTSTGYALELHNVGTALAFLPFQALGHLTCQATGGNCDGQDPASGIWLSLGNWAYGLLALVLTWRLVARHTTSKDATLAVAAVALGTSFFYYWTRFFNPHMPALFLVALFTLIWDRTRAARRLCDWLLLGLLAGAAACIASYHILILLLPASDLLWSLARRPSPSSIVHGPSPLRHLLSAALLLAGALAGFSPQMVTWKIMFGSYLGTPYGQQLFWLQPGLFGILFSSYHGLYFYAPLLLVATFGFIPLFRRDRRLALTLLLAFAATVYAASCNIAWWGGASFGARYLVCTLPWLALPLAVLLQQLRWRLPIYLLMVVCVAWTYGLFLADFGRLVDPGQYIPAAWHLVVQGEVLSDLPALLHGHLLSPRFALAPAVAVPGALFLLGLAWLAAHIRRLPGRVFTLALLALPLLAAGLLAASGIPARREIARLEDEGILASYRRTSYDKFDLSEGYWQRGAYHFVRGARDSALAAWATAHEIDPSRSWVRLHRAGIAQVAHEVCLQAGDHLQLAGWEVQTGTLALYWLTRTAVLSPTYRTALALTEAGGREWTLHAPQQPDTWRALQGDLVRVGYPLPAGLDTASSILTITIYPVTGDEPSGTLEVALDEP